MVLTPFASFSKIISDSFKGKSKASLPIKYSKEFSDIRKSGQQGEKHKISINPITEILADYFTNTMSKNLVEMTTDRTFSKFELLQTLHSQIETSNKLLIEISKVGDSDFDKSIIEVQKKLACSQNLKYELSLHSIFPKSRINEPPVSQNYEDSYEKGENNVSTMSDLVHDYSCHSVSRDYFSRPGKRLRLSKRYEVQMNSVITNELLSSPKSYSDDYPKAFSRLADLIVPTNFDEELNNSNEIPMSFDK
jgi:hypothetical protein